MIEDVNKYRAGADVVSANNLLYIIGAYDARRYLLSIEVYEQTNRTNMWTVLSSTIASGLPIYCAVVMDKMIESVTS